MTQYNKLIKQATKKHTEMYSLAITDILHAYDTAPQ